MLFKSLLRLETVASGFYREGRRPRGHEISNTGLCLLRTVIWWESWFSCDTVAGLERRPRIEPGLPMRLASSLPLSHRRTSNHFYAKFSNLPILFHYLLGWSFLFLFGYLNYSYSRMSFRLCSEGESHDAMKVQSEIGLHCSSWRHRFCIESNPNQLISDDKILFWSMR